MKSIALAFGLAFGTAATALPPHADSTGLAGDGFDLRGALDLFRRAKDLAAFEQALNTADNHVNNLDLDGDGQVDFILVRTLGEGESRVVVLQVAINKEEAQDVAVIQMERRSDGVVALQMRGDEALYPDSTIIEPTESVREPGTKGGGPLAPPAQVTVWVNVWGWPSVQWCYGAMWWDWYCAWYWGYYPPWWRPWSPWAWDMWWAFQRPYWHWYHPVRICYVERANALYLHRRSSAASLAGRSGIRAPRPGTGSQAEPPRTKDPDRQPAARPEREPQREPAVRPGREPQREPAVRPGREPQREPAVRPERERKPAMRPEREPSRQAEPRPSPPARHQAPGHRAPGRQR